MQTSTLSTFARSFTSVFLAALLSVAIAPGEVLAQQQSQEGEGPVVTAQGGLSYSAAIPVGDFDDAVGRTANGVDLYLGVRAGSLPLYIGVDFDVGQYGSESRDVSTPLVDGTFETTSNLYQPHLSARYQTESGRFRPFVEGLVGANILSTNTTWSDFGTTVEAPQDVDETSTGFSVGAGVGVDYRIARVKPLGILGLTGSFHYIYGSEVDVPVASDVAIDRASTTTVKTNTTVVQPEVGVYFEF